MEYIQNVTIGRKRAAWIKREPLWADLNVDDSLNAATQERLLGSKSAELASSRLVVRLPDGCKATGGGPMAIEGRLMDQSAPSFSIWAAREELVVMVSSGQEERRILGGNSAV